MDQSLQVRGQLQQAANQWQELFLAADDVVELIQIVFELRIIDLFPSFGLTAHQQQTAIAGDVRDEQSRELQLQFLAESFEGFGKLGFTLPKQIESDLLDLRNGEPFAAFFKLLAVFSDDLVRGAGPQRRADLEEVGRELFEV